MASHSSVWFARRNPGGRMPPAVLLVVLVLLSAVVAGTRAGSEVAKPGAGAQAGVRAAAAPRRDGVQAQINPRGYTSAKVCGSCHADIYASWKRSMHAFSVVDPIFDAAFMQAMKLGGESARRLCVSCHAPLTMVNGDYALANAITTEGVSCDFCHTVTAVHPGDRAKPFTVEPGLVKRSVLRNASSPAHQVAYSPLHASAEFCGTCHNYTKPNGVTLLGTYDEWRRGPYAARGVPCQQCHMGLRPGRRVRPEIKASGPTIHIHDLIHDLDQLRSALSVEIAKVEPQPDRLAVGVWVSNVGSGHMVPTGIPSRQVRLVVRVTSGGTSLERERVYEKVVADKDGHRLIHDAEIMLLGARILSDNRIGPQERRLELFEFALPTTKDVQVAASLTYQYSPILLQEKPMNIELATAQKLVTVRVDRTQRAGR